ncbi:MAG: DUF547 domain-containing protein [Bryobacterales bacterium]|nr:DUF547 domain-containing protein [Bryobacterales bacterium]
MRAFLLLPMVAALPAFAVDHGLWDALLKRYVNEQHRVDYGRWKQDGVAALDGYLATLAASWTTPQDKASLLNAYNALTIRWVLAHYPIESIWKTKKPFREARHTVNGEKISLDAIETRLRKMGDPRIHAALVCAARSCPPLRREAYSADKVEQQLAENTRRWLADPELNSFDAAKRTARISMIFKWYKDDFPALEKFLAGHAREHGWIAPGIRIEHKEYRWGLNDSSSLGESYGGTAFYWDALRNR